MLCKISAAVLSLFSFFYYAFLNTFLIIATSYFFTHPALTHGLYLQGFSQKKCLEPVLYLTSVVLVLQTCRQEVTVGFAKAIPKCAFTDRAKETQYFAVSESSNILLGMCQDPELSFPTQSPFFLRKIVSLHSELQFLIIQNTMSICQLL